MVAHILAKVARSRRRADTPKYSHSSNTALNLNNFKEEGFESIFINKLLKAHKTQTQPITEENGCSKAHLSTLTLLLSLVVY